MSRYPLRCAATAGGLLITLVWGTELWVRSQLPPWDMLRGEQKRCHLEAWLSGHPAQFGDGRCESLD